MQLPSPSVFNSWPAPNYVNPETAGPCALITVAVLLGVVTLLLVVRIYTRVRISRGFGLDDVFILLAYLPTAAFGIVTIVAQLQFGWGKHVWDVQFKLFEPSLQINLASQLLFALATTLTKLSMLALIYRVVSVDNGSRYRYGVLAISCVVALDGLIFFFVATFQCSPVSAYWTLSVEPQKCINESVHLLAAGCINTSTDFIIVLVPIPYVMRLNLPRKQQIIVGSLFAGGVFVTAAGAVRTFVTFKQYQDPKKDLTWNAIPIVLTSALELYIGIICASIPPIKPFFARYLPRLIGNPKYWLSRHSEIHDGKRGLSNVYASSKKKRTAEEDTAKDFWLVTAVDDVGESSLSPRGGGIGSGHPESPLVMQMQTARSVPGMPTPTRPPRTPSTLRSIPSMYNSSNNSSSSNRPKTSASDQTQISEWNHSIVSPSSSSWAATAPTLVRKASSLNKPLPRIPSATRRDWLNLADEEDANATTPTMMRQSTMTMHNNNNNNMLSVYQFVPHEDGHISVVKTRGGDYQPQPEGQRSELPESTAADPASR